MATVTVKSRVGADGVLQVDVPLDAALAGKEVEIAVTPVPEPVSAEERRAILDSLGPWEGEFDTRHEPYFQYALSHLRPSGEQIERPRTQEDWAAWVRKISGSIPDPTFVRPEQGEHEVRDSLE